MRTIIYDPQFEEDADAIEPHPEQFDAIAFGVMWTVARDPTEGERIGHTNIWAITTRPFANRHEEIVTLIFYYEFTFTSVTMLSVIQEPYEP